MLIFVRCELIENRLLTINLGAMKNVFYLARLGNQLLKVVRFNFSWKNLRLILFCL